VNAVWKAAEPYKRGTNGVSADNAAAAAILTARKCKKDTYYLTAMNIQLRMRQC